MTATLITGASSGIGLELARVFAKHRHDLVLVARTEPKLRELAEEARASGVQAHVIAADLSAPGAAQALTDRVRTLGLEIDILVNNAGYGLLGPFVETPLDVELAMIQLNIVALTELTKRLLPGMVARNSGRILNLASIAAFFPGPLMAVYYASKAYVLSFSEALAAELEGTGVTVTALCPGPTASGFQATAKLGKSPLVAGRRLPTAQSVAQAGYDAMMAGQIVCVPGASNKVTVLMPRILPRRLMAKIVRKAQEPRL
jgi:short-subunit dehydrogenase